MRISTICLPFVTVLSKEGLRQSPLKASKGFRDWNSCKAVANLTNKQTTRETKKEICMSLGNTQEMLNGGIRIIRIVDEKLQLPGCILCDLVLFRQTKSKMIPLTSR